MTAWIIRSSFAMLGEGYEKENIIKVITDTFDSIKEFYNEASCLNMRAPIKTSVFRGLP